MKLDWRPPIPLAAALAMSQFGLFLLPAALLLASGALARSEAQQLGTELHRETVLVAALVAAAPADLDRQLDAIAAETGLSITRGTDGAVLLTRPARGNLEILASLARETGWFFTTVGAAILSLAAWAAWRVSRSLRALARITRHVDDIGPDGEHARWLLDSVLGTRIAEVRQVAGSFQGTLRRLRDRLRDNEEFAANVSHEFRTPLTTLRGTMDVLMDDVEMPAEQRRRFLQNARTDVDRLLRMVQGLFDLARVESASRRELTPLDDIVTEVVSRYAGVELVGHGAAVEADTAQLELAIANLLDNALSHGVPPIRVRLWVEGLRTGVSVHNEGPGISAANLPHIFDRFFTTGADRRGTGLGLAIVRAVARAHGGDVEAESAPDRTVFRLWMPRG
ncbi:MAG: HAMP domain-containing histidine kinase [Myxococcales bacterium]|nr:HAMP domain-containing histidine kinase [Myxococcales bacterium]